MNPSSENLVGFFFGKLSQGSDMIIEVTQEDIDNGLSKNNCDCPIALAAKRKSKLDYVSVTPHFVRLGSFGGKCFDLPAIARQFIRDFDAQKKVGPFSFQISNELI